MIYRLSRNTKEGTVLHPQNTYYSDEYAQRMCNLYLKDEIVRAENGKMKKVYRLHAMHPHTADMAFAYEIGCPNCNGMLKQVGRQMNMTELGLYTCPACNREKGV